MSRRDLLTTVVGALSIFAAVRLVFAGSLEVVADTRLWQLTAPEWLVGKSLWPVILSFHAQPPGLLTLQWAAANFSPHFIDGSLLLAAAIYVGSSSVIAAAVTGSRVVGLLTALYIGLHPSTLLYSQWFFSPIYLAACVGLTLVLVLSWARSGQATYVLWAAVVLAVASWFHAAYLVAFIFLACLLPIYLWGWRPDIRKIGIVAPLLFATLLAFFAPAKNYVIFGTFAASSWAPLNIATFYTTENYWERCEADIRASTRKVDDYGPLPAASFAKSLDRDLLFRRDKPQGGVNMNHLDVLKCRDSFRLLDDIDLAAVGVNLVRALIETIALPAWDYHWLGKTNLEKISNVVKFYEFYAGRAKKPEYLYYKFENRKSSLWLIEILSVPNIVISIVVISCFGAVIIDFFRSLNPHRAGLSSALSRRRLSVTFAGMLALLILGVMIFANGQELNRMKFSLTPLFVALLGDAVRRLIVHHRVRRLREA